MPRQASYTPSPPTSREPTPRPATPPVPPRPPKSTHTHERSKRRKEKEKEVATQSAQDLEEEREDREDEHRRKRPRTSAPVPSQASTSRTQASTAIAPRVQSTPRNPQPSTQSDPAQELDTTPEVNEQANQARDRPGRLSRDKTKKAVKTKPFDRNEYKKFMKGLKEALKLAHMSKAEPTYKDLWMEVRAIPRLVGPLENSEHLVQVGSWLHAHPDIDLSDEGPDLGEDDLADMPKSELRYILEAFKRLITVCPTIKRILPELQKRRDETDINAVIDKAQNSGRTDDISRLKYELLYYLPRVNGIDTPDPKLEKESRGWRCHATARMLCPRDLRDEFDADPEKFCQEVRNGARKLEINHDNWPTLAYSETEYNPENLDFGLLKSAFLLRCWLCLFKGPSSARLADNLGTKRKGGRHVVAQTYNITRVDEYSLCYTVLLARFLLNGIHDWARDDGVFIGAAFWANMKSLFEDKKWRDDTLAWWNENVFGIKRPGVQNSTAAISRNGPSTVTKLQEQRAARLRLQRQNSAASAA
ncbi:uncharacterized protein B0H18DRAFT_1211888 [Fomitopsis serialis]|uniref:uncharacterized protein n=1 Tax=Fomitopsis serialis TaxID=139415 RepID=UPI00200851E5|nr:uncharacterized protein B0H18DRAFT_1211888 [Neoantrodia serialis]KAH9924457.1 hypothetical protein B0H18DRAFT_1211888 [Neoantrodia serialis]